MTQQIKEAIEALVVAVYPPVLRAEIIRKSDWDWDASAFRVSASLRGFTISRLLTEGVFSSACWDDVVAQSHAAIELELFTETAEYYHFWRSRLRSRLEQEIAQEAKLVTEFSSSITRRKERDEPS